MTDELRDVLRRCVTAMEQYISPGGPMTIDEVRQVRDDARRLLAAHEDAGYAAEAEWIIAHGVHQNGVKSVATWLKARDQRRKGEGK